MSKYSKVRMSLDCLPEERKLIKILANIEGMTISDYLLSLAKNNMKKLSALKSIPEKNSDLSQPKDEPDQFWQFLDNIA